MLRAQLLVVVEIAGIQHDQQVPVVFLDFGDVLGRQDVFRVDVVQPKFLGQARDQLIVGQSADLQPVDVARVDQFLEGGA